MLAYTVVDAFVVAAEYDDIVEQRQRVGHGLAEDFAVGGGEYHLVVVALGLEGADATVYRLNLYHHARVAAEGVVVDLAVAVGGIVAQVMHRNGTQAFILSSLEYGAV